MFGIIDTRLFLISFFIGIFFAYISDPQQKVIYIYPSPDNVDNVVYKDEADNCFKFSHEEVDCPFYAKDMGKIPSQPSETAQEK
jgi:hypothetical protein